MSDALESQNRLVIRRTIHAPRQKVFDAWTRPEHLKNWWRAKPTMSTEIAEVDLRVGGKYRLGMRAPEMPSPFVCFGEFVEIVPPAKLVYTWAWEPPGMEVGETLVSVEFIDHGPSTELILTHERLPTSEAASKHEHGWTGCIDRLVALLQSHSLSSFGDRAMIAEAFLGEFEHEAKTTRKFLERLPQDKLTWKPHEKSMTAGQLALHIATSVGNVIQMAAVDVFPAPDFGRPNPQPATVDEVLRAHDQAVETVRKTLPTFTDAAMQAKWQMVGPDGKEIMSMPRVAVLRSILLNHWYHHRGQFGVYLRLVGAKVPSSYGPSGDEKPDFMQ